VTAHPPLAERDRLAAELARVREQRDELLRALREMMAADIAERDTARDLGIAAARHARSEGEIDETHAADIAAALHGDSQLRRLAAYSAARDAITRAEAHP
jgi:hypothetical protein